MAPRKNALLPFVKKDKNGKLTYNRQLPEELRPFFGGRASIRRTLGTTSGEITNTAVLNAYASIHAEVEQEIRKAKSALAKQVGLTSGLDKQVPLSPKGVAGIAATPLKQMVEAITNGQITATDPESLKEAVGQFLAQVAFAETTGYEGFLAEGISGLTVPTETELGITVSDADQERINQQVVRYAADAKADIEKVQEGDFSPGRLAKKAPAKPKRQTSWKELMQLWRSNVGGVLEKDGFGVSKDRDGPYWRAIASFKQVVGDVWPNEVTDETARKYVRWLRDECRLSSRTKQDRLGCMKNLMKVGRKEGVIGSNPFAGLVISTPAGAADESGYRPFTKKEIIDIFTLLKTETHPVKKILHYILLCQGCRLSEALQLRTEDIKKTEKGVWFIDWRHTPKAEFPMLLKTKAKNNRQCPIHPRLIEAGILKIPRSHKGRLFENQTLNSTNYSLWFKSRLQKIGLWEPKKTVLHSLRGTARDLQREAGVGQDIRNALTGHQSKEIGERAYGLGLRYMPDAVYEELIKVDLNWVP